jgi:hypothetical protein
MTGPIFTQIGGTRERLAVWQGASQDIVHIGGVTPAVDGLAFLVQRCSLSDIIIVAVEILNIARDDHSSSVPPRTRPDTVPGVDGGLIVGLTGAEVGVPCSVPSADRLRQHLAVAISTREAAQISSLTGANTRDEKGHGALLRLHACGCVQRQRCNEETSCKVLHGELLLSSFLSRIYSLPNYVLITSYDSG